MEQKLGRENLWNFRLVQVDLPFLEEGCLKGGKFRKCKNILFYR
jgi:hypothetical protein